MKVNLRGTSRCGYTPLHLASLEGHENIIQLLIDNGAQINKKDLRGICSIYLAYEKKKWRGIDKLYNAGASCRCCNIIPNSAYPRNSSRKYKNKRWT